MGKIIKFSTFLLFLVTIYLFGCFKNVYAFDGNVLLKDTILKNDKGEYNKDSNEPGLYYSVKNNDKIYLYAGNVDNNNLVFNGLKFKVLGIDLNGNIKIMLTENNIKATNQDFLSVLNDWYSEKFTKTYENNVIIKTRVCDTLNKSLFCEDSEYVDVALVTLQEFNHTKLDGKTYLNMEYDYYLWTTYYNHKYYFNALEDRIKTTKLKEFNIFPVITLSEKAIISKGDGSEISPWIIANTIYGDSENGLKEDRIEKIDEPKIIKKEDIDLLINDYNLNSITYEVYNDKLYSIKFLKDNIKAVQKFDLNIKLNTVENGIYSNIDNIIKNKVYKAFNVVNTSEFPNTAITKLKVNDKFEDGDILWLYYYNDSIESLEYYDNNLLVENDYVEFNLNKGGQYILTNKEIKNFKNSNNIVVYIVIFGGLFLILLIIFRKKQKNF